MSWIHASINVTKHDHSTAIDQTRSEPFVLTWYGNEMFMMITSARRAGKPIVADWNKDFGGVYHDDRESSESSSEEWDPAT